MSEAAIKFKVKKNLSLPLIKPQIDEPIYIRFDEPMFIGKKVEKSKDAAVIANVTDLETGEKMQYLVPSVLQGIFHDQYGAPLFGKVDDSERGTEIVEGPLDGSEIDSYVGKGFQITKMKKATNKSYHPHNVAELEIE
jgi:hypothetical protein